MAEITPVTLLIGLPGAVTSILPQQPEVAVVTARAAPPIWWGGGCACCAPRDDVARALRALLPRVRRDELRRVVIETTGGADAGPILATLLSDPVAASAYRLDGIVTVVDAAGGIAALDAQERAVRQLAVADRIVLAGAELADSSALRARLRRLNPVATIIVARHDAVDSSVVLGAGSFDQPRWQPRWQAGWADDAPFAEAAAVADPTGCDARFETFCFTFDQPVPWPAMATWHERLILTHGDALVRVKAVLHPAGQLAPMAILSLGHLLFPPTTLAAWPDGTRRRSWLVVTTRDLPRSVVTADLPAPVRGMAEIASAAAQQ